VVSGRVLPGFLLAALYSCAAPNVDSDESRHSQLPAEDTAVLVVKWNVPESCGPQASFHRQFDRWIGTHPPSATIHVTITAPDSSGDHAQWRLALRVESGGGLRSQAVDASSCDALIEAAALISATQLEPIATVEQLPPSFHTATSVSDEASLATLLPAAVAPPLVGGPPARAARPAAQATPSQVPPEDFTDTDTARRPRLKPVIATGIRAEGGTGRFTKFGFRLGLDVGVTTGNFRLQGIGFYEIPQLSPSDRAPGTAIRHQALGGQLVACAVGRAGAVRFPVCSGVELSSVRGSGVNTRNTQAKWLPALAIPLSAGAEWRFRRNLSFWTAATGSASLLRPRFQLGDGFEAQGKTLMARILLGLEWSFARG